MRGGVTDAGRRTNKQRTITEDRATQPMEAGGWVSQFFEENLSWQKISIANVTILILLNHPKLLFYFICSWVIFGHLSWPIFSYSIRFMDHFFLFFREHKIVRSLYFHLSPWYYSLHVFFFQIEITKLVLVQYLT